MSTPFKFRHLDAIVGGFVIGAVALVVAALLLVGHARSWFTHSTTVPAAMLRADLARGEFLEELSESLRPGTPVELAGESVGTVVTAGCSDGRLAMELDIANSALGRMTTGGRAVIKVPLAPFMGQTRVVLKTGQGSPYDFKTRPPTPIAIEPPRDTTAMAMAIMKDLETNLGPLLENLNKTVAETHALLADVRAQKLPEQAGLMVADIRAQRFPERVAGLMERADRIAAQIEALVGGLQAGKGIAGKVLADDKLAQDVAAMVGDLRTLTATLRELAPQVPGLAREAGTALDRADRLLDGVGRHWLLKDLVQPPEPARAAPPGTVVPEARP